MNIRLHISQDKEIVAIRLRAYERLTLLLERTTPEYIVSHTDGIADMTIPQLQQQIIQTVRLEFEHNLSQQIYISDTVWDLIIEARDQMGQFIMAMGQQVPEGTGTIEFARALQTAYESNGITPHQHALDELKKECARLF